MERAALDSLKVLIGRRFAVHKLILFASRARGDADAESDVDVVVIVEGAEDAAARWFVNDCAWRAGMDRGLVVLPVVFARQEWESGARAPLAAGPGRGAAGDYATRSRPCGGRKGPGPPGPTR